MNRDELKGVVFRHLRTIAPDVEPDDIPDDAPLREEADIDSYDFLNLLVRLHDELGVEIPETDYPLLQSLRGLLDYLERAGSASAPHPP